MPYAGPAAHDAAAGTQGAGPDEAALRTDVVRLASRYGYRQITNLLRIEGWQVNYKRVERIWRQEELKVPRRGSRNGAGCGWVNTAEGGHGQISRIIVASAQTWRRPATEAATKGRP